MKLSNGKLFLISFFFINCSSVTPEKEPIIIPGEPDDSYSNYELVWEDNFDYEGLPDEDYWGYDVGLSRDGLLQDFKEADLKYSHVNDGKLVLEAHIDPHPGKHPYTGESIEFGYSSAEIISLKTIPFKYGRIDVSAKIPIGRGVWPAIWMMPLESKYGGWPKSGEIDIMEYVWGDYIHNQIQATIHTFDTVENGNVVTSGNSVSNTLDTAFHLYSLIWKENYLEILFDNTVIFTYNKKEDSFETWPFDQSFYLILNIAVGGWGANWGIDDTIFPARMEIDYVRYYKEKMNN